MDNNVGEVCALNSNGLMRIFACFAGSLLTWCARMQPTNYTFYFKNEENRDTFLEDPWKYAPSQYQDRF